MIGLDGDNNRFAVGHRVGIVTGHHKTAFAEILQHSDPSTGQIDLRRFISAGQDQSLGHRLPDIADTEDCDSIGELIFVFRYFRHNRRSIKSLSYDYRKYTTQTSIL